MWKRKTLEQILAKEKKLCRLCQKKIETLEHLATSCKIQGIIKE